MKPSRAGYFELKDQEEDPRLSINSNSPILPKLSEEDDIELPLPGVTYETNGLESHFRPIDEYEGAHRYDPDFVWHPDDEKKVVRKVI
jgi:hypothetical protein